MSEHHKLWNSGASKLIGQPKSANICLTVALTFSKKFSNDPPIPEVKDSKYTLNAECCCVNHKDFARLVWQLR